MAAMVVMPPGGLRFIICIGVWGGWVVGGGNDQERRFATTAHTPSKSNSKHTSSPDMNIHQLQHITATRTQQQHKPKEKKEENEHGCSFHTA